MCLCDIETKFWAIDIDISVQENCIYVGRGEDGHERGDRVELLKRQHA